MYLESLVLRHGLQLAGARHLCLLTARALALGQMQGEITHEWAGHLAYAPCLLMSNFSLRNSERVQFPIHESHVHVLLGTVLTLLLLLSSMVLFCGPNLRSGSRNCPANVSDSGANHSCLAETALGFTKQGWFECQRIVVRFK